MKNKNVKIAYVITMIIAIAIPLLAGVFSAMLTAEDMKVYEELNRPLLSPPGWLFPIVWTVLYILMGLASFYVYISEAEPERKRKALLFYAAQLVMNVFWCTLFFTYRRFLVSLIWLLVMWVLIIICVIRFWRIRRAAGIMMTLLLAWTTFAAYLNLAYYILSI